MKQNCEEQLSWHRKPPDPSLIRSLTPDHVAGTAAGSVLPSITFLRNWRRCVSRATLRYRVGRRLQMCIQCVLKCRWELPMRYQENSRRSNQITKVLPLWWRRIFQPFDKSRLKTFDRSQLCFQMCMRPLAITQCRAYRAKPLTTQLVFVSVDRRRHTRTAWS